MKTFCAPTSHRANANPTVQRRASGFAVDTCSAAQRKMQAAINGSAQLKKATLIQRMAQQATTGQQPVIQRNKHLKRFLNVATFGIRKAYVKHKRAQQAAQTHVNINEPVLPAEFTEDDFVRAYEKSRYYHNTSATNVNSIDENGLLNYEDRVSMLGDDVVGMSLRAGGEYKGDEKKGVFMGPKKFMLENNLTTHPVRAFLSADRTVLHHWNKTDVPDHQLVRDEKFRGGAVITKNSVYGSHVTAKKLEELLDSDDPKLQSILDAIASHHEGSAPDATTMKGFMRSAIRNRRLSNAAFDNV